MQQDLWVGQLFALPSNCSALPVRWCSCTQLWKRQQQEVDSSYFIIKRGFLSLLWGIEKGARCIGDIAERKKQQSTYKEDCRMCSCRNLKSNFRTWYAVKRNPTVGHVVAQIRRPTVGPGDTAILDSDYWASRHFVYLFRWIDILNHIHFGRRSLRFFFEGPKWPRTVLTKDWTDSVTLALRTDLSIKRPARTSIYKGTTYITELQMFDCTADNNYTGQFSCLLKM